MQHPWATRISENNCKRFLGEENIGHICNLLAEAKIF